MKVKIAYKRHHLTSIFPQCSVGGGIATYPSKSTSRLWRSRTNLNNLNLGVMLLSNPGENTVEHKIKYVSQMMVVCHSRVIADLIRLASVGLGTG